MTASPSAVDRSLADWRFLWDSYPRLRCPSCGMADTVLIVTATGATECPVCWEKR